METVSARQASINTNKGVASVDVTPLLLWLSLGCKNAQKQKTIQLDVFMERW